MDDKSDLRWYEKKWEEDNRRWEKERQALQKRLDEQAEEILELRKKLAEQGSTTSQQLREQLQAREQSLKEQRAARERCEKALQETERQLKTLSRPALGEGFFRHLGQNLELWDQVLIEEARTIGGTGLGPWLSDLWEERREALSRTLEGQPIDWRRLRTGLVLEWALLAWLEGVQDG